MHGPRFSGFTANVSLLALLALTLTGCLMEEPEEPNADIGFDVEESVELSGSVGDGPIVGARIQVRQNDSMVIAEFDGDGSASYNITVRTRGKYYPLVLESKNGLDLVTNMAPDFTLKSAVTDRHKRAVGNINPFSTLAMELASEMSGGITISNIEAAERIVVSSMNCGLTSLATSGPINTIIDDSNVAEIVRASEALGETIRRVRDALTAAGQPVTGDDVVRALASDLRDWIIDGQGGSRADARIAAVAIIASTLVQLETMSGELRVLGVDATTAMNNSILQTSSSTPSTMVDDLTATAEMLLSVRVGLAAASTIDNSGAIEQLIGAVDSLRAGMHDKEVRPLLPGTYQATLDNVLLQIAGGDATMIDTVNTVSRNGGEISSPSEPPPAEEPPAEEPPVEEPPADEPPAEEPPSEEPPAEEPPAEEPPAEEPPAEEPPAEEPPAEEPPPEEPPPPPAPTTGSVTLNWSAPTQNEDGTPLTDLAGYKIYWGTTGTTAGDYPNSVTIDNPGITTYVVDNLEFGTYEFVATSFNTAGIESSYSNPATKTVQ